MNDFESVYVARQPVFDRQQKVWGYELLFRSSGDAATADVWDDSLATSRVIADGVTLALPGIGMGQKALINFPESLLLSGSAYALPSDVCVVEILETARPTPEVLGELEKLRQEGFTLAMDDFTGEEELLPFLNYVDILKVDILALGSDPERIREALARVEGRGLTLLAEKVEDQEVFHLCAELGFDLFQGFFFSRPEVIPGKKISTNEAAKLQLLRELSQPDFEFSHLAEIIRLDPSLSYRLFRYVNSAAQGFARKVESVDRALTLLGQNQASQWLRAVILSDINPAPRAREVSFLSLQRARFLWLLCGETDICLRSPDALFTLGLFSLLDTLMAMPMADILVELPLDEEVSRTLLGEATELTDLLRLVRSFEAGSFEAMERYAARYDLDLAALDSMYSESMVWVLGALQREAD
ncbi:MAG: EAL and HDOD domain-containing protein [Desulfovibrionaceae bacterium]